MTMNRRTPLSRSSSRPAARAADRPPDFLFPLLDLKAQFASIRDEVMAAITRVMESQRFIMGEEVRAFEREIARLVGVCEAVGCASGTAALELSFQTLGVRPGDEIITTPYTFVATAGAVASLGARPVFVDIEPETFNLNPSEIERAVTPKTRAIVPVHLFGLPADLDPILQIARERHLTVIEDAAQAIGARYHGDTAGSLGAMGCFSFFPSKNLGGAGDGGMVTTNDPRLADRLRLIRAHGSRQRYHYEALGTNSRLDAVQAAILRVKLRHLADWNERRQEVAGRYLSLFGEYGLSSEIVCPRCLRDRTHVYHQFVIRCRERDSLRAFLRRQGIPSEVYYPLPLHLQPAFAYLGYHEGAFPNAEAASRETLALPIYPELKDSDQALVASAIGEFCAYGGFRGLLGRPGF